MKLINRYVLKEHLGPFTFALSALTSLMLLQYIAKRFSDLVGKGLPWRVIAEFFVLSLPFTVAMTLPMAILVAVLYAFSRLGSENEITALKAGGVSTRSLMTPVLIAATCLAIAMLWFNDQVLPEANHSLETLQNDILRTKPTFALREQVINAIQEGHLYLRANQIDEATQQMTGVDIWDVSDPQRRRTIIGAQGVIALAQNQKDLDVTLHDGMILSVPSGHPEQLDRLYYRENRMRVRDVANEFQQTAADSMAKGDREMSICEMQVHYARAAAEVDRTRSNLDEDIWIAGGRRGPAPPPYRIVPARGIGAYYCTLITTLRHALDRAGVRDAGAEEPTRVAAPRVAPTGDGTAQVPAGAPGAVGRPNVQLATEIEQWKAMKAGEARFAIEIEKKFSLAAACIVLALVGAPIALRFPRGGVGLVIGVSFSIFALYYVCLIGGESLANNLIITPFWAMWAANIIFGVVGLVLFARMGHESTTGRGGEAAEVVRRVRDWLAHRLRGGPAPSDGVS